MDSKLFDDLLNQSFDKVLEYSHEQFVDAVSNNEIKFSVVGNNKYKILKGRLKLIFYSNAFLYTIAPLIFIPLIAYHYNNWYLLFGILISYLGSFLAGLKMRKIVIIFSFYSIVNWFLNGFHFSELITFSFFCLWNGTIFFLMASGLENAYAKLTVLMDEDVFNQLSIDRKILIL